MIRKVLRKLERLKLDKAKLINEQKELQKKIDDIDIEIKNYNTLKKEYEKLDKKYKDLTHPPEASKNE
jgi:DNA gyrase/topoisomerase IV subunit A